MKLNKKITTFITIVFISISTYSQTANVESIKKENLQLKKELSKTKIEKDTLQLKLTKLTQDTTFLRKEISLCTLYSNGNKIEIANSNNNFKATFISCIGSRATQSFELTFMIQHNITNQVFYNNRYDIDKGKAYDALGQIYNAKETFIGGENSTRGTIPTGVPIMIKLVFNNVLPGNDLMKIITFKYDSYNSDESKKESGVLEFRNIKIIWN